MWWLLDRTLVDRVVKIAAETAPLPRSELVGVLCTFTKRPLAVDSVDPSAVRFALAALHRAAETQPSVAPLLAYVERAVFESAAFYSFLTGIEVERAAADVELIAAQLVLVAPVSKRAGGAILGKSSDREPEAAEQPRAERLETPVPSGGEWFEHRIRAVVPILQAMAMIRSADSMAELASDKTSIAQAIRAFVAGDTWPHS